ncbi:MAG: hypothetical protein K6G85_02600 [Eubacterium sp.]|nr:hypothetical protein [Eubacterium sp.]
MKKQKNQSGAGTIVKTIIAILVFGILLGVGINSSSKGRVWRNIKKTVGIQKEKSQPTKKVAVSSKNLNRDYAPDLQFINDDYFGFVAERGLILVSRVSMELVENIDLQEIDCFYFKKDSLQTRILQQDRNIIIFNTKNGKPQGKAYVYSLDTVGQPEWTYEIVDDPQELQEYYKQWKSLQKNKKELSKAVKDGLLKDDKKLEDERYSKNCIVWKNLWGDKMVSFLSFQQEEYVLVNYEKNEDTYVNQTIRLIVSNMQPVEVQLPEFRYTEDNTILKAIFRYEKYHKVKWKDNYRHSESDVWIPGYVVWGKYKKNKTIYAFVELYGSYFQKNGKTLEDVRGGRKYALLKLKKIRKKYRIVSTSYPRKGGYEFTDIQKMTKNMPGVYEKVQKDSAKKEKKRKSEKALKKFMKMYIQKNQLDILSYRFYGRKPIVIKEKETEEK